MKFLKIAFPIVALIFLAYFYIIRTRNHAKRLEEKKTEKENTGEERI